MFWLIFLVFLASLAGILHLRRGPRDSEVGAQFVVTGTLLLVFYAICFCSGVCTILNFIFRWVL